MAGETLDPATRLAPGLPCRSGAPPLWGPLRSRKERSLQGVAHGDVLAQNRIIAQRCGLVAEASVEGTLSS
jgi:hypothetical protein